MVHVKMGDDKVINFAHARSYGCGMDSCRAGVRLVVSAGVARVHKNGFAGGCDDQRARAPFHVGPINVEAARRLNNRGGRQSQYQCQ